MRLLLIRHGQTPANVLGRLDTDPPGPGLTPLGVRQSVAVPAALRLSQIRRIYASTLVRTQLTAEPLADARRLPVQVLDGLREIEAGNLEDFSDPKSQMTYLMTAFAWAEGDLERRMPGGPTGHEFFTRFDSAITKVVADIAAHSEAPDSNPAGDPDGYIAAHRPAAAVFCHGMAIRTWAASRCANIDGSYASSHELDNTGVVVLDSAHDGNWLMSQWVSQPVGGIVLSDDSAADPTGETLQAARRRTAG